MTTTMLTDTHREIQAMAREFAQAEIAPHASDWSRDHHVPVDLIRKMGELGLLGVTIPEEYGGAGLDYTALCLVMEEVARADAGASVAVAVQNGLAQQPILKFGSEEQKAEWLPVLSSGELLGCYALTEAEAGSDAGSLSTKAERQDDGSYRISGSKMWITNGGFAEMFVIFARTAPGGRGISAFVSRKAPGVSVSKDIPKLGLHSSSTAELAFDGLVVAEAGRLGQEGEGLKVALATLDGGRITIAAQACGIAQAALDLAVEYAGQRVAFGGPIARFQGVQFPIADIAARLDAARLLTLHAASVRDAGLPHTLEGAKAKLVASRVAVDAADMCVQVLGGYGYSAEYPAERLYRDAKITEIYEGTSEIQRLVIARGLLGDAARG